ncbi:MAG: LPS export ABC transporter periplasmic protein LptC [Candidatus Cloacimonetes bacterium]|nr:LPS export ABC transporter periplasmic protein LptC [Candidatus Cloacimonadota bacterium]
MKKLSKIFWLTCAFSILFTLGCQKDEIPEFSKQGEEIADQEARNIIVSSTIDGVLEYKMKANYMEKFIKKNITYIDTVEITSYRKDGSIEIILTCNRAELDEVNNVFVGTGDVVVTSDNAILKTPYLRWDRLTDKFLAKNGVTILREGSILQGEEMRSDALMNTIEITKVSAEGTLDEKDIDW